MEWKAVAICHPLVIQKKGGGRGLKGVQGLSTTASTWPCWKSRNRSWRRFFWDKDFIQCRGGGRVNKPQQTPLNQFYKEPGSEKVPRLINNPLTAPEESSRKGVPGDWGSPLTQTFQERTNKELSDQKHTESGIHEYQHFSKRSNCFSPVVENQQTWWLGGSVTDCSLFLSPGQDHSNDLVVKVSAESLHKPLQVHHQPPRAVFLWKCNQVMPGGWPKQESQPIQNT